MAMVSSLFTAISGMRNHQTLLDVISNNVANVNTIGFKSGRVTFSDMLSQTLSSAVGADPLTNRGGVNPVQMGTGVSVASIDTVQTQGTLQATGIASDMAITGDGYFVLQSGTQRVFTRAGNFDFDSAGRLVGSSGELVQGWSASVPATDPLAAPRVDSSNAAEIGNITINSGQTIQAHETRNAELVGNLDAGATYANLANSAGLPGTTEISVRYLAANGVLSDSPITYTVGYHEAKFSVYDSLGNAHELTVKFTNLSGTQIPGAAQDDVYANNTWAWTVDTNIADESVRLALDNTVFLDPVSGEVVRSASSGLLHFTEAGALDWVVYGNRNADHFGTDLADPLAPVDNDPSIPGGSGGTWQTLADADLLDGSVIGFEGRIYDLTTGAVSDRIQPHDYFDGTGEATFDPLEASLNPNLQNTNTGYDMPAAFSLMKLPIVLVYENVAATNMAVPTATLAGMPATAGTRVQACDASGNPQWVPLSDPMQPEYGINLASSNTIEDWYVQQVYIDWGTVSTVTKADFDRVINGFILPDTEAIAGEMDGAIAGDDQAVDSLANPVTDGHEYPWDPRVVSRMDGGRDGTTQDVSGSWQIIGGVNTYVPEFTIGMRAQDGYKSGVLQSIAVAQDGTIYGSYNNDTVQELARVAVARFENPGGMVKLGNVNFVPTANSGGAVIGTALTGGRGAIVGGALEQSNVDLSAELTNMILAQRGFEVNARLITTSDRILDTLVNLGR